MKILFVLAVVTALLIAAILYFGGGDLDLVAPKKATPDAAAQSTQSFQAVSALLLKEMNSVPTPLDAPEFEPVNAFSIKSRVGGAAVARQEYQVLAKACDLIIYAAQEHTVRQREDQAAQVASPVNARVAVHIRDEAGWNEYRRQTDAEVKRLLGTLDHASL